MTTHNYTYVITNIKTNMKYIGVRSCRCGVEDDSYMSSSKSLKSLIKSNPEDFVKEIIMEFDTREEAVQNEIFWHNHYNVGQNTKYYNKAKQTSTGFDQTGRIFDQETKIKCSIASKRNWEILKNDHDKYQKFCASISLANRNRTFTQDHKDKISLEILSRSPQKRQEIAIKRKKTCKQTWDNKSPKEKLEYSKVCSTIKKEMWENRDATERQIITEKIQESRISNRINQKSFHGYYHTPFGILTSANQQTEIDYGTLKNWCVNSTNVISSMCFRKSAYLSKNYDIAMIGKTFKDLGFWFEPKP